MTLTLNFRRKIILILLLALLILAGFLVLSNTYFYYDTPIMKVTSVEQISAQDKTGVNGRTETLYTQRLTGTIQNGSYKGTTITCENQYSNSQVTSEKYNPKDRLFVKLTEGESNLKATVLFARRDPYLFLLVSIFLLFLILVSKKYGLMTLLSMILNIAVFCFCLYHFESYTFFKWIWILVVVFFCIMTLLLVSGFHKKTWGAILSSIATVLIVYSLYQLLVSSSSEIPYEMMSYTLTPLPLKNIYMVSVILGMLGAVMDVAITVNASVSELVHTSPEISIKGLVGSIREIGYDIMGTMVNVLFFTYLSASLPTILLKIHSGYGFATIIRYEYVFDIIRFLIGAIGIVLTIPVAGFISVLLFRKGGFRT